MKEIRRERERSLSGTDERTTCVSFTVFSFFTSIPADGVLIQTLRFGHVPLNQFVFSFGFLFIFHTRVLVLQTTISLELPREIETFHLSFFSNANFKGGRKPLFLNYYYYYIFGKCRCYSHTHTRPTIVDFVCLKCVVAWFSLVAIYSYVVVIKLAKRIKKNVLVLFEKK